MAIHKKRKHRVKQQTAVQATSTNQQSAVHYPVWGQMMRTPDHE